MKKFLFFLIAAMTITLVSCHSNEQQVSDSGVTKATVIVPTDANGNTAEQSNLMERNIRDNKAGSIKHLYVVSSFTGDVLQYSTVRGKVTSGGKRLSPRTVNAGSTDTYGQANYVQIGKLSLTTPELMDENGTYGDSGNYLFWFDAQGNYQQYYPSGGTYLQISDRPLRVKKSALSLELVETSSPTKVAVKSDGDSQMSIK